MNIEEYYSIVNAPSEDRNREFKKSFPWNRTTDGETMAKVVKSILAMSNLRDVGRIVIGVDESETIPGKYEPLGVKDEHLETYSYDKVADFVRDYAEPYAKFELEVVPLDNKNFIFISVSGFDEVPVICKRSYGNVLSQGTVYVRSRGGRPRSEPISLYVDTRELWDIAIERGVRKFLETQQRIGQRIVLDSEKFIQELGDFK